MSISAELPLGSQARILLVVRCQRNLVGWMQDCAIVLSMRGPGRAVINDDLLQQGAHQEFPQLAGRRSLPPSQLQ